MMTRFAFSFVELCIVIFILILMSAIAIRSFSPIKFKYEVQRDIKIIYSSLQEIKNKAFFNKYSCRLCSANGSFSKFSLECDFNYDRSFNNETFRLIQLNHSYVFNLGGNSTCILFSPEGFAKIEGYIYHSNSTLTNLSCLKVSKTLIRVGNYENGNCVVK